MLVLQALQPLHALGRGHCDLKLPNLRVVVRDNGTLMACTIVDLGGSVKFCGKRHQPISACA